MDDSMCIFDIDKSTPIEKCVIMLMERIQSLEEQCYNYSRKWKIALLMSCASSSKTYLLLFKYLLGLHDVEILTNTISLLHPFWTMNLNVSEQIKDHISKHGVPQRVAELHNLLGPNAEPLDLIDVDNQNLGNNMLKVLENLTDQELDGFLNWRLKWTRWHDGNP